MMQNIKNELERVQVLLQVKDDHEKIRKRMIMKD